MTNDAERPTWSAHDIRGRLASVGVRATSAEAAALAVQATPYLAMLDRLVAIPTEAIEPVVTFAIDDWTGAGDE